MRSSEENTPSITGLLSPDGSPRIDIKKSLRKKRDPTKLREALIKDTLDVKLDYAPISMVSPTGSIISSRSPKDGEIDETSGLKGKAQPEPLVFYNKHPERDEISFSESARMGSPVKKRATVLVVEDIENFTFQKAKEADNNEQAVLEDDSSNDRSLIRLKMKQERLNKQQMEKLENIIVNEEPKEEVKESLVHEEVVHEEPVVQKKKKKKHKKSAEEHHQEEVEMKQKKLKEIKEIVEEDEQTQIVENDKILRKLHEKRKENKESTADVSAEKSSENNFYYETRPKQHSVSSTRSTKPRYKAGDLSEDQGRNSDHHLSNPSLELLKGVSNESQKRFDRSNSGSSFGDKKKASKKPPQQLKESNLRQMVIQRQASSTYQEYPEKVSPLLTGESYLTGMNGAVMTNDNPLLKNATPESMNFTTAVSMITTSRTKTIGEIADGKEKKEKKDKDKDKKKSKHHHHHKSEKGKKSSSSSKKKKHHHSKDEDNIPLSGDFKERHNQYDNPSRTDLTPVIKPALLTDGLDLVKLMIDRRNRKKAKLIIVLFTLMVVLTLIMNGLELAKFNSAACEDQTYEGVVYVSFALMIILKIFCISLFNLELTYKQSYDPLTRMLYPFLVYFLCPLLQLPQNVYNFDTCVGHNKVINLKQSWSYVGGILGSLAVSFLYFGIKKSVKSASTQVSILARACAGVSNIIKFLMVLSLIAWNVILFVMFGSQKVFVLSLFFDFLVYLILGFSVIVFLVINHRFGEHYVADFFVKIESEATQIAKAQKSKAGDHVEIVVKDEEGKEISSAGLAKDQDKTQEKHELGDIQLEVH